MLRNLRNRSVEPNSSTQYGAAEPEEASDETTADEAPAAGKTSPADKSIRGRLNRVTRYATQNQDDKHSQDDKDGQDEAENQASDVQEPEDQTPEEQEAMALTEDVVEDTPDEPKAAAPVIAPPVHEPAPIDDDVAPEDQILTVGRGIRLAAEVCECDTLVVEGQFEAKAKARLLQIPARGGFKGEAEVAEADISGTFDGTLTVSGRLTIHGDAVVFGEIQYGEVVIEAGGQIGGQVGCLTPRRSAAGVKAA